MPDSNYDFLDWLGLRRPPDWAKARILGILLGCLLTGVVPLLFLGALGSALAILRHTVFQVLEPASSGPNLGAGALIAALLGAPFVIWGTVLKHQSLRYQKEGHITDRISKAVEQLGAEKKVDRIGRPVTIWYGEPERVTCSESSVPNYLTQARTKASPKVWEEWFDHEAEQHEEGYVVTITTWPQERTIIQWQGEAITLSDTETIGVEGDWSVFSESLPNIEVRVGSILSLERIAQDSTRHDRGRDHVRIMEIICAYIRENAPAKHASPSPYDTGSPDEIAQARIQTHPDQWIASLSRPRADIEIALIVLGRRSTDQVGVEQCFKNSSGKGYCLDLSHTNLRRANLTGGNFEGASFFESCLEGAYLNEGKFSNCNFIGAALIRVGAGWAIFDCARFDCADISHAVCDNARFRDCSYSHTYFVRTQLIGANFKFQENTKGNNVNRAFFVDANIGNACISGDANGIYFTLRGTEGAPTLNPPKGIAFRNARIGGPSIFGGASCWQIYKPEYLTFAFGDSTVELSDDTHRPSHWPSWALADIGPHSYDAEYRKWLAAPDLYTPPLAFIRKTEHGDTSKR